MVLFLKSWDELAERLLDAFFKTDDSPKNMKQTKMKPVPANDPFVCTSPLSGQCSEDETQFGTQWLHFDKGSLRYRLITSEQY